MLRGREVANVARSENVAAQPQTKGKQTNAESSVLPMTLFLQLPWIAGCAGMNISLSLREPIRVSELFVFHTLDPLH